MKNLIFAILIVLFYKGFFTNSSVNNSLVISVGDKNLHLIVFFIFPLIFHILLRKNTFLSNISILFFGGMTYGVEIIQKHFTNRYYSFTDFKYSLIGFSLFCGTVFIYYLIQTLFHTYLKHYRKGVL